MRTNCSALGLCIKAVGIVTAPHYLTPQQPLGTTAVAVDWLWQGLHLVGQNDKADPLRGVSVFEELNPRLQKLVTDLLLRRHPLAAVGPASRADPGRHPAASLISNGVHEKPEGGALRPQ
jgi:hypothetical protein